MMSNTRTIPNHFAANAMKSLLLKEIGKEKKQDNVTKEMEKMFSTTNLDVAIYAGKFIHIETEFDDIYCKCDSIDKDGGNILIKNMYVIHGFIVSTRKKPELNKTAISFKEEHMIVPGLLNNIKEISMEEYNNKVNEIIQITKTFLKE